MHDTFDPCETKVVALRTLCSFWLVRIWVSESSEFIFCPRVATSLRLGFSALFATPFFILPCAICNFFPIENVRKKFLLLFVGFLKNRKRKKDKKKEAEADSQRDEKPSTYVNLVLSDVAFN
jgi:hypothetical protein